MKIDEAVRRMGSADTYKDPHWNRAVKVTDKVIQKAAPEWLEELLLALLQVKTPTFPMRYGFEVALRRLATAAGDADRVTSVRAIATEGRDWGEVRYGLAEVAEWLASGQPPELLLTALETADPTDELAACLLQETALRHDATAAAGFASKLRAAGHPLAELPLRRTPAEHQIGLPHYAGLPQPPWHTREDSPQPAPGPREIEATATELDWPDARQAQSAHRTWFSISDGTAETRLFLLDRPLSPTDFGASLLHVLNVESVGGMPSDTHRATTADTLQKLFSGATGGSAYGSRMYGAYGRLAAWESLAALAGIQQNNVTAIEQAADQCTWLFYTSDWHIQVHPSMDVGIAVLRPDHRTVAILAATDAD